MVCLGYPGQNKALTQFAARKFVIRRPPAHKPTRRAHLSSDVLAGDQSPKIDTLREDDGPTMSEPSSSGQSPVQSETLSTIRALLKPPPIPDVENWGIPPGSAEEPDPTLQVYRQF